MDIKFSLQLAPETEKQIFVIISNPEIPMVYPSWYQTCLEHHSIALLSSRWWDAKILN